jgi:hypothetical protein
MATLIGVRTRRHVLVVLKDATGTPITCTLGPGPGDFKMSGFEQSNKESVAVYDRGGFLEQVEGDDLQPSFSLTVHHAGDLTAANAVHAALNKTDDFAAGVTVDPGGIIWALTLVVTITRSSVTNTYTLTNCRCKWDYSEGKDGNTIAITGTCYGGYTVT